MAYSIRVSPRNLIVNLVQEPEDPVMLDMERSIDKARFLLDGLADPVYLVIDMHRVHMEVDDFIRVASSLALGTNPLSSHPNVIETVFVSAHPGIRVAVAGLTSAVFNRVRLAQVSTLEEALAYCERRVGAAGHALAVS
jgi:hypothetical protein